MKNTLMIIFLGILLQGSVLTGYGWAQSAYSIKEMTPEVKAALENRRERFDQLAQLKQKGVVGENSKGYVDVLVTGQGAEDLAKAENQDRQIIYKTIAQQNNLGDVVDKIEKVFAEVQRDKAQPGDKIQNEEGSWVVK